MNEIQAAKVLMKEKVVKTVKELKVVEGEKERLMKKADEKISEKDDKIKELEILVNVKDKNLLDLGEEKREAIRQLCILVDYQRDRYDHLLSRKMTVGRKQTAR
ncbi:unnamed protein product [Lactuca virosa]|nr:unnamed protein product [Lactuca virosa]